jgi:2-phospho-L-lactate guanylyltransferase
MPESPERTALLLPIKDLRNAKQRLAGVLSANERRELAEAMLADTTREIQGASRVKRVFVVTNYEPALELAARNGWEAIREEAQLSESASVDFASRVCEERGVTRLLRLPLDIPLVHSADIDAILSSEVTPPGVLLVPSRDGTGTNAILRTPPALFSSHFGPDSLAKHRREAERAGANIEFHRNERVEMDVDDEADLRALLQHDLSGTCTGKWLDESGVAARFRERSFSAHAAG